MRLRPSDFSDDPRPCRLLERFDQRYTQFVGRLSAPLSALAQDTSTFKGRQSSEIFQASTCSNLIYTCTPWLFWELFSALEDETFLDLAFAGGLVSLASVLMDHLVDDQTDQPKAVAALRKTLLREGVRRLQARFPWRTAFWGHFKRLHREHLRSLAIERHLQDCPKALTEGEFEAMAGGKVSPVVITVAALSLAAGVADFIDPLERALKQTFIAGQLHDDVLDWQPDLEEGHLTHFLTQFLVSEEGGSRRLPDREAILAHLDSGWQDVAHLEQAIAGYRKALAAVDGLDCPAWVAQLEEYVSMAEMHRSDLIRAHVISRLSQIVEGEGEDDLQQR